VIEKDVPNLQIIEQELWNAVKQRQTEVMLGPQSTKTKPWDRRRPRYLLSGLVRSTCMGRPRQSCNSLPPARKANFSLEMPSN
jgi:hypothetical protein